MFHVLMFLHLVHDAFLQFEEEYVSCLLFGGGSITGHFLRFPRILYSTFPKGHISRTGHIENFL